MTNTTLVYQRILIPDETILASRLIKDKFICFAVAAIILSGISGTVSRGIVANALTYLYPKHKNPVGETGFKLR